MKKLIKLLCALQCCFIISCRDNDKNISFHYTDSNGIYSMDARFSKNKTKKAERYMNEMIGRQNNVSFLNTESDAVFTLDDGSKFYMQKSSGHIKIRMNKDETSDLNYHAMKQMCEGMKDVVLK
jgi:hypothetical protein